MGQSGAASKGGNGGIGIFSTISGSNTAYAGGGGAGINSFGPTGLSAGFGGGGYSGGGGGSYLGGIKNGGGGGSYSQSTITVIGYNSGQGYLTITKI